MGVQVPHSRCDWCYELCGPSLTTAFQFLESSPWAFRSCHTSYVRTFTCAWNRGGAIVVRSDLLSLCIVGAAKLRHNAAASITSLVVLVSHTDTHKLHLPPFVHK